jgi:hypothetical protein
MSQDCLGCKSSQTAETPQSVVVLCRYALPPVVVAVLRRKEVLRHMVVTPRECPKPAAQGKGD